ncbi:thymosin beta-4-like [Nycticebus coucang]|uniref:thymosin beta-4-like n=1 Tax=Nycticebus coucang TaxID=9470 RepID=UPI00234CE651|nr:thymosin beta-4-like [Nycticebus coucang]
MTDKPGKAEMEKFIKLKLKKTERQEKNPLPSPETIKQGKQAVSGTTDNEGRACFYHRLSSWQGRKRTTMLVKEEAGWDDRKI